jgi:DNA-binding IclR family transcriptional regulator
MSEDRQTRGGAPAVERAVRILEYLAHEKSEASLSDIAGALDLNKSTCFNILKTLQQFGVVVRDSRFPIYRLGPKLVELGTASRRSYSYRDLVKREANRVVEKFGVTCLMAQLLPNDAGIVVIDRIVAQREGALTAAIGQVHPLTVPAMGRAVLAARPFAAVVGLMDVMSVGSGDELTKFSEQLEEVRQRGFASSLEEYQRGVNAVASTILGPDGDIVLILCLMGTVEYFPADRALAAGSELHQLARHMERVLLDAVPTYALDGSTATAITDARA